MNRNAWAILGFLLMVGIARPLGASPTPLLVEAESFKDLGGWGLDQQFMDQMGSPYLLAHGLGTPVKDAVTEVKIERGGTYKLWVRTKDWVAQWDVPGAPGKFQVMINGQAVPVTFGTEGAKWHWQDGGTVELPAGAVKLALHDLTGFEGRCDAILFSADPAFTPPNELKAMTAWRRQTLGIPEKPAAAGAYDLVVVGGGIAGTCAALNAARLGLKVAVIQDRPVLGGNNSVEVSVELDGGINLQPYPRVGDVVKELDVIDKPTPGSVKPAGPRPGASPDQDAQRLALVRKEKNIALFLEYHMNTVEAAGQKIQAAVAENIRTGRRIRLTGTLFADCTGDGQLGALAGADFDMTLKQHMGVTNPWTVIDTGGPVSFPRCPWALDLSDKPFIGRVKATDPPGSRLKGLGRWNWESGFDWHPIDDVEAMRDWNFRAMYGAWDALKNVDAFYPRHKLIWAAYVTGKRESRRLLGDVLLTVDDFMSGKKFDDACYPCTWGVDLHYPHPDYVKGFEGRAFLSQATATSSPTGKMKYQVPYWVPYRCLYSRNIDNLFMAGRDVSVTHEALGPVRVMRTTGMSGEIVGLAAAVCIRHGASPREVYTRHLKDLKALLTQGVPKGRVPDATERR